MTSAVLQKPTHGLFRLGVTFNEEAMNNLLLFLCFLWVVTFLLYACLLVYNQRGRFLEKMSFLDLWIAIGSISVKRKEGLGSSDEERLRELEFKLRRAVFLLVLLMIVTFMALQR